MLLKIRSFFLRLKDIRIAQRIWIFLLIFIDYNYLISNVVRVYGSIVIINRYCFIYFLYKHERTIYERIYRTQRFGKDKSL